MFGTIKFIKVAMEKIYVDKLAEIIETNINFSIYFLHFIK